MRVTSHLMLSLLAAAMAALGFMIARDLAKAASAQGAVAVGDRLGVPGG